MEGGGRAVDPPKKPQKIPKLGLKRPQIWADVNEGTQRVHPPPRFGVPPPIFGVNSSHLGVWGFVPPLP